jgi:crotonobetainyl-CoA:carnitine CoA-transferase CaiB-like acyl-CoA transferase
MGPLKGLLVVDLTRAMAGPYCTMMLADMGARVIKVERPGKGDDTRGWGPPFLGDESVYFLSCNRNKESIALDLKAPEDMALLKRMIAKADVLVENFRPGVMARYGLDWEGAKALNPLLVYGRITGFGSRGPYASRTGYDLIAQGMGGFMGFTGHPGGPPTKVGLPVGDINAGMFLAYGIATALVQRAQSGEGQLVETSLYQGQLAQLTYQAGRYFANSQDIPGREGNRHPLIVPYATYQTSDGWVNLAVGSAGLWERFCRALGKPELLEDTRFRDNPLRVQNRETLDQELSPVIAARSTREMLDLLEEAGVPCGPVNTMEEILEDEHTLALDMVVEVEHQTLGPVRVMGLPLDMGSTPGAVRTAPPVLDQHGEDLRQEFAK